MTQLFDPDLISPYLTSTLPPNYVIRPLRSDDYAKGFLSTLAQLTDVGQPTAETFAERFSYFRQHAHEYFTIVIEDVKNARVVAAGTVFIERKFIRNNGLVGHIEDIVVLDSCRGMRFGWFIIEQLKYIGASVGCYKGTTSVDILNE
jgi:glucosamine-phosphate N-acetyltransferase